MAITKAFQQKRTALFTSSQIFSYAKKKSGPSQVGTTASMALNEECITCKNQMQSLNFEAIKQ